MRHTDAGTRRYPAPAPVIRSAALAALLAGWCAAGCAPTSGAPPRPAPVPGQPVAPALKAGPRAGYDGRRDSLDSVDAAGLRGKRIVLDPGHGGVFPGTQGVKGLTEKEVNLGVGLALRDLLVAAGAEVQMTRETDRDYLTLADSSLRSDLAERVRIANAFVPDLFVSIHHNADPGGLHDVNESQTYYQLGDEGPAYDVAQDVFRALTRNLGIETTKMIPGNFFVVRNSEAPALLSEASYLTYPPTEAKLRDPAAQRLEAEILYLGIARYFTRRIPKLESFAALDAAGRPDTLFTELPRLVGRVAGAFDAARMRIDGRDVPVAIRAERVEWLPSPLASGPHDASFSARLATEGGARASKLTFTLRKPAARLALSLAGSPLATARGTVAARVRVFDADGLALPDSVRIRVSSEPRGVFTPAETTITATDGEAFAYLRRARTVSAKLASRATLVARLLPAAANVAAARLPLARQTQVTRAAFALLMPESTPLALPAAMRPAWLDRNGFVAFTERPGERTLTPQLAGFRCHDADTLWPPRFVALAGGALHGRRICIDPEGGGDDAAGSAPGGSRGSGFNLDVSRALASMLMSAGAQVVLTRDGDHAVSELERVQIAEGFRAERYLRIGHANAAPLAGYYFSSGGGKRWAAQVARTLGDLGLPLVRQGDSAKYPLSQTSAVALYVSTARTDSSEGALLGPGRLRAEAYALFVALARDLAGDGAVWPTDSLRVLDAAGAPLAGAPVRFGAALVLSTDAQGTIRFARSEPGALQVVVEAPRAPMRAVLLDSERGRVLQSPR